MSAHYTQHAQFNIVLFVVCVLSEGLAHFKSHYASKTMSKKMTELLIHNEQ